MTDHDGRGYALDPFQEQAIASLRDGRSVLVAAPTGAGKTVVAEAAVELALAEGGRAFYTTPIKALSNQKYRDLGDRLGPGRVGLLTGDNAIDPDAAVVVMTTEVLRNMLYARSPALEGLRDVVLDEVHFLTDAYRGPVWEEVIINLAPEVRLTCLSATVSNAEEVAAWLRTVRGATDLVVESERPVELLHDYVVEDRAAGRLRRLPVLVDGAPNPDGARYDQASTAPAERGPGGKGRRRRRWATPRRVELVAELAERDQLPAIVFVFSRAGCEDAVDACLAAGVTLSDPADRATIRAVAERHCRGLDDSDLEVLGYPSWLASLEAGVAAHHAGMVPPFKEAVEELFTSGLIGAVFATETLALGINMPARSVVIDKLTKFTGERHEFLSPAQYTQLAGRAGRRGIDDVGHVVVAWSPYVSFEEAAGLVASRSFPLTSVFRPTYNMTANLVRRVGRDEAHHLLSLSLAQYQVDQEVVRVERRLERRRAELAELESEATCERGDVAEYAALVDAERAGERSRRAEAREAITDGMARLSPGDVVRVPGRGTDRLAVLSVSHRRGGDVRVRVIGPQRRVSQLSPADLPAAPERLGRIELPTPFAPRSGAFQRGVALSLRRFRPRSGSRGGPPQPDARDGEEPGSGPAAELWSHPVADCPDSDGHLRALRRLQRRQRDVAALERKVAGRTGSLSRQLDQVLELLEAWGYVADWELTGRGRTLIRVFHECDLLVAEAVAEGLFDDLDAASLAGLASCFTYQRRAKGPAPAPWFPTPVLRHRWKDIERLSRQLAEDERRVGLPSTREPEPGLVAVVHAWAKGIDLTDVLDEEDITPGDFVRQIRQLTDVLRQIADAAARPQTQAVARAAADAVFRGVVSAATSVEPLGEEG